MARAIRQGSAGLGRQRLARWHGAWRAPGIFLILLLMFGCAPKVKVVYVPVEQRTKRAESWADRETVLLLKKHYERWRGTPYRDGGMSPAGVDCSGFTVLAYRDLFGLDLPRTAAEQAEYGREVAVDDLEPGDLVFFQTGVWKRHVGIYLADDQFIHASLSRGVTLSSLEDAYWRKRFRQARRMPNRVGLHSGAVAVETYR